MAECRWVLDTDALGGRLLLRGAASQHAPSTMRWRWARPWVSDETLTELAKVLSRPRFGRRVTVAQRRRFVLLLGGLARRVTITHRVQVCHDPKDDTFLHVALNGGAEAIVTGDWDLPVPDPLHGVRIPTPADFCAVT